MSLLRRAWLRHWRFYHRWHRYSVEGFEHLEGPPGLILGYHGRSIARDLCMLSVLVHDRLGYMPRAVFHRGFGKLPVLRQLMEAVDGVTGDAESLGAAVAAGQHLLVTPGGTREGCRTYGDRYRVHWPGHGYLKLALKYGLDLIPVVGAGTDDTYIGLNDGHALGERLKLPLGLPCWLGVGPLGLWPASPPFPVKIHQLIGPRIRLPELDRRDPEALPRLHLEVTAQVQSRLDRALELRPG